MSAFKDVRYAARVLARTPLFAVIVVVTLALGIGGSAAVFAVANAVLIKELPYHEPDGLVALEFPTTRSARPQTAVPSPAYAAWAELTQTFESLAAFTLGEVHIGVSGGEQIRVAGVAVSPSLLSVLHVTTLELGRAFTADDAKRGAPRVAVVSYRLWRDQLGANRDLTHLRLIGDIAIVGVLPPSFQFPDITTPDVMMPLLPTSGVSVAALRVVGRLKPDISLERAESELAMITEAARPTFPPAMETRMQLGSRPRLVPLKRHLGGEIRPVLFAALGVSAATLLTACANVAGLLLARTRKRDRETTIRIALGGTPSQLARLIMTETLILASCAGLIAVLVMVWSLAWIRSALAGVAPYANMIVIDARVSMFTLCAVLVTATLCGAVPIGQVFSPNRGRSSRRRSLASRLGRTQTAGRALIIAQVSATMALLVVALLLLGTLWRLTNANVGFDPRRLLTLRVPPYTADWSGWPKPRTAALAEILQRIRVLKGVASVAATTSFPLDGHAFHFSDVAMEGDAPSPLDDSTGVDVVSPGYFRTMGVPVKSGRDFDISDTLNARTVAIVNEAFIRWKALSSSSAIGRRITMGRGPIEIVGVVGDVKEGNPRDMAQPIVYRPFEQAALQVGWSTANIVVRIAPESSGLSESVRQVIRTVLPGFAVYDVRLMEERMASTVAPQRQRATVFACFGLVALTLAGVGLHGLLAFKVSQTMREYGIRVAMGAGRVHLAGLVFRQALVPVAVGLALGVGFTQILTRQLEAMLYGVRAADPAIYCAAAAFMGAVAALASYAPAHRAMRANPLDILRSD